MLGFPCIIIGLTCMALLPKSQRGLRCTNPFCDFECMRDENCSMGDAGGDTDIDDTTVLQHDACARLLMLAHARAQLHAHDGT
jgi:hypothetical protein